MLSKEIKDSRKQDGFVMKVMCILNRYLLKLLVFEFFSFFVFFVSGIFSEKKCSYMVVLLSYGLDMYI